MPASYSSEEIYQRLLGDTVETCEVRLHEAELRLKEQYDKRLKDELDKQRRDNIRAKQAILQECNERSDLVDAVEERTVQLEYEFSMLKDASGRRFIEGEEQRQSFAKLQEEFESRLAEYKRKINKLETALKDQDKRNTEMKDLLSRMEGKVNETPDDDRDRRLDQFELKFANLERAFSERERRFADQEERMTALETELEGAQRERNRLFRDADRQTSLVTQLRNELAARGDYDRRGSFLDPRPTSRDYTVGTNTEDDISIFSAQPQHNPSFISQISADTHRSGSGTLLEMRLRTYKNLRFSLAGRTYCFAAEANDTISWETFNEANRKKIKKMVNAATFISFGQNGSYFVHSHHIGGCKNRGSDNLKTEYPGLIEVLSGESTCVERVTLGLNGRYAIRLREPNKSRIQTMLCTRDNSAHRNEQLWKRFWFGASGTYVLVDKDGALHYDLGDKYPELKMRLEAELPKWPEPKGDQIKELALNLYDDQSFVLALADYKVWYNDRDGRTFNLEELKKFCNRNSGAVKPGPGIVVQP